MNALLYAEDKFSERCFEAEIIRAIEWRLVKRRTSDDNARKTKCVS
jgi:hypothetical protein